MDNFNLRNLQLAYGAVYDQNLCESMEELGLIGEGNSEQDQVELWVNELLDEGHDLSEYTWDELYEGYKKLPVGKMIKQASRKGENLIWEPDDKTAKQVSKMARVASRHSQIKGKGKVRGEGQAELNRRKGEMKEDYDAFDVVLEYLLDEGFAETVESAEAIMVNMSEGWIETILEGMPAHLQSKPLVDINAAERKEAKKRKEKGAKEIGWKDRSHIKSENPLITVRPGDAEEAKKVLKSSLPKGDRIMGPGFFPSRTADRVAAVTSSFTRGEDPSGGEARANIMPKGKKPRRIPSRLDKK